MEKELWKEHKCLWVGWEDTTENKRAGHPTRTDPNAEKVSQMVINNHHMTTQKTAEKMNWENIRLVLTKIWTWSKSVPEWYHKISAACNKMRKEICSDNSARSGNNPMFGGDTTGGLPVWHRNKTSKSPMEKLRKVQMPKSTVKAKLIRVLYRPAKGIIHYNILFPNS